MPSPFPLLRLPRLVLFEVFKSLNIEEKIKLSLCSKKTVTQINIARLYSQKVIVVLDILSRKIEVQSTNGKERIHIFNSSGTRTNIDRNVRQYQIGGRTVPVVFSFKSIQIFWKNNREGFLNVTQHLLKIFQCKISTESNCYYSDLYRPIIFELFDQKLEFETITIPLNGSEDETLWNQLSSNLGLVENLKIVSVDNLGFRPVFTSWPQNIIIFGSAWFTLEYLLACTCTIIILGASHLENKDLEETLKKWKTGGFPNLEYLSVYSRGITNNGTTILGMNPSELQGMVIRTDDGSKKATINTDYGRLEIFVTPF
ncbi:hypothetical protein CRE_22053 [Caenorhabditis remanei]|uniref:F-box domain-containing protein n=1 Tax=Caenorhabditis remanei TaxID=31234 RepID=E3N3K4_CAERE|nr:hypothetical protein CRE_22053 [Caenorhabditis remanei]